VSDTESSRVGNPVVLRMDGISKSFPGIRALITVDLEVRAGQVHAIVGENGAGKSTLMRILNGVYQPDEGKIELDGVVVRLTSPIEAKKHGIAMVYQELNLVPDLTVAENICLGATPAIGGFVRRGEQRAEAERVLSQLDAGVNPDDVVGTLSVSQQQIVEIAKAYRSQPRIVVLDEPTSSLSEHEVQAMFRLVRRLRDKGAAVIYISHRLREVLEIADQVTVLRDGRMIESRPIAGITTADMIRLMVGRELTDIFPKREVEIGDPVLKVSGLSRAGAFHDVEFEVRSGEILGMAGLVGAGRTEVARAIFGLDRSDSGTVTLDGQERTIQSPAEAVRTGIAYVPEDRKRDGLVQQMSIRDNITLAILPSLASAGWIRAGEQQRLAVEKATAMTVNPPVVDRNVDTLSGGNQQKVVLAKWLATKPRVLILDEPTRGVDVGAKSDIHHIIGDFVAQGTAVILISSELPEVIAVSDRILVLHEGAISAVLPRGSSEQDVMRAATGEVEQ